MDRNGLAGPARERRRRSAGKSTSPPGGSSGRFSRLSRTAPPAVKDEAWVRTPIDRFVLAKLEQKGLTSEPARRAPQLIRRAYFDLIGLPPTPEEVEAFVDDPDPRRLREADRPAAGQSRTTASAGPGTGSTWPASPSATATSRTTTGRTPITIATS